MYNNFLWENQKIRKAFFSKFILVKNYLILGIQEYAFDWH